MQRDRAPSLDARAADALRGLAARFEAAGAVAQVRDDGGGIGNITGVTVAETHCSPALLPHTHTHKHTQAIKCYDAALALGADDPRTAAAPRLAAHTTDDPDYFFQSDRDLEARRRREAGGRVR